MYVKRDFFCLLSTSSAILLEKINRRMKLKIAIQKSGRLYDESIALLRKCGLKVDNTKGQLKAPVRGYDAEVYFLRNSDIPRYLADGVVDIAVIGQNVLAETDVEVDTLTALGFSNCRLSIASPRSEEYNDISDLQGKRIATSYPVSLQKYLTEAGVTADIHTISGSVEIAPSIGLADAVCDLVSSGSTLFKNGLEEREILLTSEAVLAANKTSYLNNTAAIDELTRRVKSVTEAKENKYILFNVPNEKIAEVSKILPVLKSPTLLPLAEAGWSSMHSVIKQSDFWTVINELRAAGAEGILVIPIDNIIL